MKVLGDIFDIVISLGMIVMIFVLLHQRKLEWAAMTYLLFCHYVDRQMIDKLKDQVEQLEKNK